MMLPYFDIFSIAHPESGTHLDHLSPRQNTFPSVPVADSFASMNEQWGKNLALKIL